MSDFYREIRVQQLDFLAEEGSHEHKVVLDAWIELLAGDRKDDYGLLGAIRPQRFAR